MEVPEIPLENPEEIQENSSEIPVEEYPEWFPVADLGERFNLKSAQSVLDRRNFLQISPYKRYGKKVLSGEQLRLMDSLHAHIQEYGSFDGFPVPPPSGPDVDDETAIATTNSAELGEHRRQQHQSHKNGKGGKLALDPSRIQSKAVQEAKETLIAAHLAQSLVENPELLPEEDREEIQKVAAVLRSRIPQQEAASPEQLADQFLFGLNLVG